MTRSAGDAVFHSRLIVEQHAWDYDFVVQARIFRTGKCLRLMFCTGAWAMTSNDDFRFEAHKRLLELDAAISDLMMLVVAGKIGGVEWSGANARYDAAHSAWTHFLKPKVDDQASPPLGCLSPRHVDQ